MKKSRYSEEQIIAVLKEHRLGRRRPSCAASTGSREATFYIYGLLPRVQEGFWFWSDFGRLQTSIRRHRMMVRPNGESAHARLDNWSASKAIIEVQGFKCADPDPSTHFPILPATSVGLQAAARILVTTSKHGPDDPCVLVGDRNRGTVVPRAAPEVR